MPRALLQAASLLMQVTPESGRARLLHRSLPAITSGAELSGCGTVRSFIYQSLRLAGSALLLSAMAANAHAQEIRIGLAAPLSGAFQLLGEQFVSGARMAAKDGDIELIEVDDGCTAEGGEQAAHVMAQADVSMVIGFLCTPAIEAAMPELTRIGVPVLTPLRAPRLTDARIRTGWPIWRLGPRLDDEPKAVARLLVQAWRDKNFAIIDDGTIYGRELAENLRVEAELARLEPVLFDTFRPQLDNQVGLVGRLRRSGATHVFVGGDRSDIAIIARDARKLNYDVVLAGGEALRAAEEAIHLPKGVLMVGPPLWEGLASPEVLHQYQQAGIVPEGYTMLGHAAVDVAAGAIRAAKAAGKPIEDQLRNFSFDTAIGQIRFNANGDLTVNPYQLYIYDGMEFIEGEN